MRKAGAVSYLFGDHLGSTSVTTSASGARTGELWYKPWGESRGTPYGTTPTTYRFTGQREGCEHRVVLLRGKMLRRLSTRCQEYLGLLERHFSWLFDEFAFVILQVENGYMDSCSFLLQGSDCRLFFAVDRGRIGLSLITMVPSRSRVVIDLPGLRWYALADVTHYLSGHFPGAQDIQQRLADAETQTLEETIAEMSAECRPLWPDVMAIFREDGFEMAKTKLDHAIQEGRAGLGQTK
jgi:hypothetical protein